MKLAHAGESYNEATRDITARRGRSQALCVTLLVSAITLGSAQPASFDVHLQPKKFTLYEDPYNGNEIKLGGFSGLFPVPGKSDSFYVVADRGPAPDFVDGEGRTFKVWMTPEFGPHIVTVRLMPSGKAKIDDIVPLTRPDGAAITGLPTTKPATDVPYDRDLNVLPFDDDSLDVEGITIDPWGNFWVCEEYKPSVAMVDHDGVVRMRLIPAGTLTGLEQVPTYELLPAVLAKRRNNRGFEGIAATSDGMLYAAVQRPLNNPNRAAADASQNIRLVAINLNTLLYSGPEVLVRQLLYRIETVNGSITLSDLFATSASTLLVPERGTDKLFEINVAGATDITPFENSAGRLIADTTRTIENLNASGLASLGITPVAKTLVLDSITAIDPLLDKVEGVCVVGGTIILTYDNDFNVADTLSIPLNANPDGPLVQLELLGNNLSKVFTVPMPAH